MRTHNWRNENTIGRVLFDSIVREQRIHMWANGVAGPARFVENVEAMLRTNRQPHIIIDTTVRGLKRYILSRQYSSLNKQLNHQKYWTI